MPIFFILLSSFFILGCDSSKELDEYGGYYDEKLQIYRYQSINPNPESIKGLVRPFFGKKQVILAEAIKLYGNMVWFQIDDRNVYTLVTQDIDRLFKNDQKSQVAIALEGISLNSLASRSISKNEKRRAYYNAVFSKLILKKKVEVIFTIKAGGRILSGTVFLSGADHKKVEQSLNYWLIKNGLSPYILPKQQKSIIPEYIKAEDLAKKNRKGIWG